MGGGDVDKLRVFISYRREDSTSIVGRIRDKVADHVGADNVFYDIDTIPYGVDFREHIDRMVADCHVALVVIGPRWLTAVDEQDQRRLDQPGDVVRLEVEAALQREIPVVPLLVDGASIPQPKQLPESLTALAHRNAAQVRHDPDFHSDMERLLRRVLPSPSPRASPHPPGGRVPLAERPVDEEQATGYGTVTPPDPDRPAPVHSFTVGDVVRQPGHDLTYTVVEDRGHVLLCVRDVDGAEYEMNPVKLEAV